MTEPLLDPAGIGMLRAALRAAGYTSGGVADRIGPQATAALGRADHRAALRATEDRDPLATLIRLFICAQAEPHDVAEDALAEVAEPIVAHLVERGFLEVVA